MTEYDTQVKRVQSLPFWRALTSDEQALITQHMRPVRYTAGQEIHGSSHTCLGMVMVLEGVLRASLLSPDGREVTLYRIKAGEDCMMAAACALDAVSFETRVEAEEDSELLLIPIDIFMSLVHSNIYVERDSYKMAAERFSDIVQGIERLVFLSLEQRIAAFLLDEAADSGSDTLHTTHEQLAVNIGSAREAVSRTLKGMEARGLVSLTRGGVTIADKAALYDLMK